MVTPPDPSWKYGPDDPTYECGWCGDEMSEDDYSESEFNGEEWGEPDLAFCSEDCRDRYATDNGGDPDE